MSQLRYSKVSRNEHTPLSAEAVVQTEEKERKKMLKKKEKKLSQVRSHTHASPCIEMVWRLQDATVLSTDSVAVCGGKVSGKKRLFRYYLSTQCTLPSVTHYQYIARVLAHVSCGFRG